MIKYVQRLIKFLLINSISATGNPSILRFLHIQKQIDVISWFAVKKDKTT